MNVIRVTEEWQRAAAYYVRARAMCDGFGVSFQGEFADDSPEYDYVLAMDGEKPVSVCRIHDLGHRVGKIERVATLEEYRGKHFGQAVVREAENWMRERGISKVLINSREAALEFYRKLGYIPDYSTRSGSGEFVCVMTEKILKEG